MLVFRQGLGLELALLELVLQELALLELALGLRVQRLSKVYMVPRVQDTAEMKST